ncbi:MAG TPA: glycosyltransferase, partial [Verrucomicrobiae bacterium]|nr:glycosyltransferase [Verrucomicrobiae bacterium]
LNSFFSPLFGVANLFAKGGALARRPAVLAPRGEFSPGALAIKRWKKMPYLWLARRLQVMKKVVWQATSPNEEADIRRVAGTDARVFLAPNLGRAAGAAPPEHPGQKQAGKLRVVFLSRISRMKNLEGAIRILDELAGEASLDIYGPLEDERYWRECQKLLNSLPAAIKWRYCGEAQPENVGATLSAYDVLLLPTLGENYGHVIVEALVAGCPVLISDRTPWRSLAAAGCGWDFPLEKESQFREALARLSLMGQAEHARMRQAAREFGLRVVTDPGHARKNSEMFLAALAATPGRPVQAL